MANTIRPMTTMDVRRRVDLSVHGIVGTGRIVWNPSTPLLYEHAVARGEARISEGGPLVVDTGRHTGRSPRDKFVVREPGSEGRIWWDGNQEYAEDAFERLRDKVTSHLSEEATLYVVDAFAGADPEHRIGVRVVTTHPYHALFARTMFIDPLPEELPGFSPQALVLHAPGLEADPDEDRTRTGTFIVLHPSRSEVLIGGTDLRGRDQEVGLHRHELPAAAARTSSRCTARRTSARDGDVRDLLRALGHGQDDALGRPRARAHRRRRARVGRRRGLQLRGRLLREDDPPVAEAEPEIYRTTRTFGTILENVAIDEYGELDLDDASKTENTRAAYPLEHIANAHPDSGPAIRPTS